MNRIYDADTGVETLDSLEAHKEIADIQVVEAGQALEDLKSSKGFKLLQSFLQTAVEFHSAKLLSCRDMSQVLECQEIIKSYQGIFSWIETSIDQARHLKESK